jgi:hypothetical protein
MKNEKRRELDPGNLNFLSPVSLTLGNKETKDALEKAVLNPNVGVKGFISGTLKMPLPFAKSAKQAPVLQARTASLKPEMQPLKLDVSEELAAKKTKPAFITLLQK